MNRRSVLSCLLLTGVVSALPVSAEPRSVSSRPAPERNYRLFVGIDVKVRQGAEMVNVADFEKQRLQLDDPSASDVSLTKIEEVRFVHTTKLGRTPVTIGDVKTERSVDNTADRMETLRSQAGLLTYGQDRQDFALAEAVAISQLDNFGNTSEGELGPGQLPEPNRPPPTALADREVSTDQLTNSTFYSDRLNEAMTGDPDTLEITAEVRSDYTVRDAYIVGVARIRDQEGEVTDVLIFQEVPLVDQNPRKIYAKRTGLPKDFELLELKLHLYDEGKELTTSASDKQFALTRDEALEYVTLERVSSHRGKTLPPEPVWSLAPDALLSTDRPDDVDFPMMVKVDERGQVIEMDAGNQIVPAHVSSIVEDLLFYPALQSGSAVAGTAEINLRDYFR